jgi:ComF family protein
MPAVHPALRRAAGFVLDLVLPPRCPSCREIVTSDGSFCVACWARLDFLTAPLCACCGLPFAYAAADGALCGACLADPPAFDRARAAVRYDDASSGLVLALKYADRTQLARPMARLMARAVPAADSSLVVVPVPLHPRRLRQRLFNQAVLLARPLARHWRATLLPDALERRRDTPPTRGLSRAARLRNVAGAIALSPRAAGRLAGRDVLLVDDVMTTGATVDACARQLRRAGARNIDVVTFARVAHDTG